MTLIVPKHYVAAQLRQDERAKAVATTIARGKAPTVTHRYDSDDFVTPADVQEQLLQLQAFIDARREVQPGYQLPQPSGWRMSFLFLTIPETTASGLVVASDTEREARAVGSPQGVILGFGPAAYKDPKRFPDGAWHNLGDRVSFTKYDAATFQLANGQRLGFLNDTQPLALIDAGWRVPE